MFLNTVHEKNVPVNVILDAFGHDSIAPPQIYLASIDTSNNGGGGRNPKIILFFSPASLIFALQMRPLNVCKMKQAAVTECNQILYKISHKTGIPRVTTYLAKHNTFAI